MKSKRLKSEHLQSLRSESYIRNDHILQLPNWIWNKLFSCLDISSLCSVVVLSKSIHHAISKLDCWNSSSATYTIIDHPKSRDSINCRSSFWTCIQHLIILEYPCCLNSIAAHLHALTSLQSLTCDLEVFSYILLHHDRLNINKLVLSIGELDLMDTEINRIRQWGLTMPYVQILELEFNHDDLLDQITDFKLVIYGARFLPCLHCIETNTVYFRIETHQYLYWTDMVKYIALYVPNVRHLNLSWCSPDALEILLKRNNFIHLQSFQIMETLNCEFEINESDWKQLSDTNRFSWSELVLSIKGKQRCSHKPVFEIDEWKRMIDEKSPLWFFSVTEKSLHIGIEDTTLIHSPSLGFSSLSFLHSFKLYFSESSFCCPYSSMKAFRISSLLRGLIHLKEFTLGLGCEKVETSTFVMLLQACTSLSPSLQTLTLPLCIYPIAKKDFDLKLLFSRLYLLKNLFILSENEVQIYYDQRYLSYLPSLEVLSFPLLHKLSYTTRTFFMEDLPISLKRLHSCDFCMYKFSLSRRQTVRDWWTSYLLKLPSLICTSLSQDCLPNIYEKVKHLKCRNYEDVCRGRVTSCCDTFIPHVHCSLTQYID
ncbi:MAG: hypothetical protein Sylvanvirus29_6 [Sylvanvirus sp.]|uniref:F-box domain-containing protein n=1 Tax=Sylvanvirus sp. TaxID=2487774 RepID=A0A3G5AJU8_9VIRU|nr:MAG: hypothetical protein Sylvanvirus29_6 [Sylvanvirus sp.]